MRKLLSLLSLVFASAVTGAVPVSVKVDPSTGDLVSDVNLVAYAAQAKTSTQQLQAQKNIGIGQQRDLYSFTASGNGVADDSGALASALTWWYNNPGVSLVIGPGAYRVATPIRFIANSNRTDLGKIVGMGGIILSDVGFTAGTGTVAIDSTGTVLTGTSTAFLTQLKVGDQVEVNSTKYTVRSITSDTAAVLYADNISGTQSAGSTFKIWPPTIQLYSQGSNRRPEFTGLNFKGSSSVTGGVIFQLLGNNGGGQTWDGVVIRGLNVQALYNTGFQTLAGVFEAQFYDLEMAGQDGGANSGMSDTIQILQGSGGDASSIHLFAPNTRGGLHGIVSTVADLRIYGGTSINAAAEGVYLSNHGGSTEGYHVENNFFGAGYGTGTNSGFRVIGSGPFKLEGIYGVGTESNSQQTSAIRVYTNSFATVLGCYNNFNTSGATNPHYMLNMETGAMGHIFVPDGLPIASPSAGTLYQTGICNKIAGYPYTVNYTTLNRGKPVGKVDSRTYAASLTPHLLYGYTFVVKTITGNLTINDPDFDGTTALASSALAPVGNEVFSVELQAEATGGRTVTFGSGYLTNGALTTTINKTTVVRFQYSSSASKWIETGRSAL